MNCISDLLRNTLTCFGMLVWPFAVLLFQECSVFLLFIVVDGCPPELARLSPFGQPHTYENHNGQISSRL